MAFQSNRSTDLTGTGFTAPSGVSIQGATDAATSTNLNLNELNTLYEGEHFFTNVGNSASGANSAYNIDGSNGRLVIGGTPRGDYDSGATYVANDAVRVDTDGVRRWYIVSNVANANSNAPGATGSGWREVSINNEYGSLYNIATNAAHGALGTGSFLEIHDGTGGVDLFNTVVRTSGAVHYRQAAGGNTLPPSRWDEVVFYNTHTTADRIPYLRWLGEFTTVNDDSYIGRVTLDGRTNPFGLYLQGLPIATGATNHLRPEEIILSRGVLIGNGSQSNTPYTVIENLNATANASRIGEHKYDVGVSNSQAGTATVNSMDLYEVLNSADGTGIGFYPRQQVGSSQGAGSALVTSEFSLNIQDDADTPANVNGVEVLMVPRATPNTTVTGGGSTITYNPNIGSQNADPNAEHFISGSSITDVAITGTTNADGNLEVGGETTIKAHVAYWQTVFTGTNFDAAVTARENVGNDLFVRLGDEPYVYVSEYGYTPGVRYENIDLRGINVKEFNRVLPIDASVTDRANRPADTEVIFAENANNGFGNDDVISIANDISMDRVYDRIHAFQVDETVAGEGRTSFNQSTTGTLVDMGARFVRIDAITGGEANSEIRQGTIYTGMTNIQDLHINNGATIRADIGVRPGQSIYWTSGQGPALAVDGGDINGVLRLQAGTRTIANCDVTNLTLERDQGETGDVVVVLDNVTGGLPSILGSNVSFATRITSPALSGGDDSLAVFDYTGGTLVSTTPIHTFTGAQTIDQTVINGLGDTVTRILTVYTSNTALPEIREYSFVSGETVTIAVTGTTDTLIPAVEPSNVVNFSTDLSIDTSGANPVFVLRGAGFTQGGIDGHAYYNAYNVRNSATYREFLARTHVARTGNLAGDGVNSYLTEDNRLVLSGSLVMTCSQNFLLTPMLVNPQAQVWAWDNRDGVQVGIGGIFGEVTGTGDFGGAEFSLADVDYPRIEQGQSDAVDTIVTEMQSTGVSLNDDAITDIGERMDTELRRSPATRGGRS